MSWLRKHWYNINPNQQLGLGVVAVIVFFFVSLGIVNVVFANKVFPGVKIRGVNIGGLTKNEAIELLNSKTNQYLNQPISLIVDNVKQQTTPIDLGVGFDNQKIVEEAFNVGRDSNPISNLANQTMLLLGIYDHNLMQVNLNRDKLSSFLIAINQKTSSPAQNAVYKINGQDLEIIENSPGRRIDLGLAPLQIGAQISNLNQSIYIPKLNIVPERTTQSLARQKPIVVNLIKNPIVLTFQNQSWEITRQQLLDWLTTNSTNQPKNKNIFSNYYEIPPQLHDFKLEKDRVANFLEELANQINQEPIDATLTITDGRAVVFKQSRDGRKLNIEKTTNNIISTVGKSYSTPIALSVDVQKAEVSNDNIDKLGIRELIGEGISYFPGSTAARLQNIKIGAARYNGVLLKPGQVFSFGEILGEVGPAQGYAESKVILDGRQEFQYGGGLCQVSSTAFRAALNAGLPILERTNHAFQVSYYTQPYGVPGVDATIYYPAVDFKFKNDTSNYILIQTVMNGTTLKFSFYGTKEKEGRIRGPQFVFGSLDVNQPSQTVFWRDVIVNGQITKTDTFVTYYKSALEFPSSN